MGDARTFSRIRVVAASGTADLAVPDDISVAELIRQATAGSDIGYDTRWVLSHPARGPLDRETTLGGAGILDGEQLHLVPEFDGHPHPYVDDVAEEAAAETATRAGRRSVFVHWLTMAGAAATAVATSVAAAAQYPALAAFETSAAITILLLIFSFALRPASLSRPETVLVAAMVVPAAVTGWAAAVAAGATAGIALAVALAASAAAAETAGRAVRPTRPALRVAAVAGGVAATFIAVAHVIALGVRSDRGAAVGVCLVFAGLGFVPRLAVEVGGLGRLADEGTRGGRAVRRAQLRASANQTRWLLFAVLAGFGAAVAVLAAPLARAGTAGGCMAVVSGSALLLRARYFRHTAHMMALAVPGVGTLLLTMVVATFTASGEAAVAVAAWITIIFAGVVAIATPHLGDVGRAHVRVWLGRAETLVVVALVPVTVAVFGGYSWVMRIGN